MGLVSTKIKRAFLLFGVVFMISVGAQATPIGPDAIEPNVEFCAGVRIDGVCIGIFIGLLATGDFRYDYTIFNDSAIDLTQFMAGLNLSFVGNPLVAAGQQGVHLIGISSLPPGEVPYNLVFATGPSFSGVGLGPRAIPEPGMMSLLVVGLLGLVIARRVKK